MDPEAAALAAGVDSWCTQSCQAIRIARGITGPTELAVSAEPAAVAVAPQAAPQAAPQESEVAETDYDKWCGESCQQIRAAKSGGSAPVQQAESSTDAQAESSTTQADASSETIEPWCTESCQQIRQQRSAADTSTASASSTNEQSVNSADASGIDLASGSRQLGFAAGTVLFLLPEITDERTASKALPQLNESSEQLSNLSEQIQSAPDSSSQAFKTLSKNYAIELRATANSVLARDGVSQVIGGTVESILGSVNSLGQ